MIILIICSVFKHDVYLYVTYIYVLYPTDATDGSLSDLMWFVLSCLHLLDLIHILPNLINIYNVNSVQMENWSSQKLWKKKKARTTTGAGSPFGGKMEYLFLY